MESAVRFRNARGEWLQGILHEPDAPVAPGAPGLVWVPAGQKVRQGAWRMNVAIARRVARLGVPVLRFDCSGLGDSEGVRRHGQFVMDFYGFIQTGGFRDDVVAAANFLQQRTGVRSLVLGGLCGGAASALFAGPALGARVYGQVLIDLPVTISSSARQRFLEEHPEELVRARPAEADTVLTLYARKALDGEAWRRFLSGESNMTLFVEALRVKLRGKAEPYLSSLPERLHPAVERLLGPAVGESAAGEGASDTASTAREEARGEVRNHLIAPAFRALLATGQRVRMLNSSTYHPTFMGYFGQAELGGDPGALRARGVELTVAPDTNHIFSLEHSQRLLFEAVESMVREAAGGSLTVPAEATRVA